MSRKEAEDLRCCNASFAKRPYDWLSSFVCVRSYLEVQPIMILFF